MHNIKYSKQALIDIDDAIEYISTESKINALAYLSRYENKIELLKLNPNMGAECKTKLINRDCRVLVHESHTIIYKVDASINEIFIIRIFHNREEYKSKLNGNIDE
jgi:plasmid stabilization system protein ParE